MRPGLEILVFKVLIRTLEVQTKVEGCACSACLTCTKGEIRGLTPPCLSNSATEQAIRSSLHREDGASG
jgi:hypothetical protein